MVEAEREYAAGNADAALSWARRTLACRDDARVHRAIATYACAAHEVGLAKAYYDQLPSRFQPAIVERCKLEGITIP